MGRRRGVVVGIVVGIVVGVLAAGAGAVLASTGGGSFPLKAASTAYQTGPVATSSKSWSSVPGLGDLYVCPVGAPGGAIVNASMNLSGGAVGLRVVSSGTSGVTLSPGPAHFVSSGGNTAFSFTWVGTPPGTRIALQWRSPTGSKITATDSDLSAIYSGADESTGCA